MIEKISRAFKTSKREEITRTSPNRVVEILAQKKWEKWSKKNFNTRDNWKFDMSLREQRLR